MKNQRSDEVLVIDNSTEKIIADLKPKKHRILFLLSGLFCNFMWLYHSKVPNDNEIFVIAQLVNMSIADKESFSKIKFFIQKYSVCMKVIGALDEDKTYIWKSELLLSTTV